MHAERMAELEDTVVIFTVDRVSYSLHPPVVVALVEFDGGGRFACELTSSIRSPWTSACACA
jgi:uncharacterized OB-fold protein